MGCGMCGAGVLGSLLFPLAVGALAVWVVVRLSSRAGAGRSPAPSTEAGAEEPTGADAPAGRAGRACPDRRCRHVNLPEARFCAQCGRPLPHRG